MGEFGVALGWETGFILFVLAGDQDDPNHPPLFLSFLHFVSATFCFHNSFYCLSPSVCVLLYFYFSILLLSLSVSSSLSLSLPPLENPCRSKSFASPRTSLPSCDFLKKRAVCEARITKRVTSYPVYSTNEWITKKRASF